MHVYDEENLAGVRGRFARNGRSKGARPGPAPPPRAGHRSFRGRCWWLLALGGVLLAAGIVLPDGLLIAAGLVLSGVAAQALEPARPRPRSVVRRRRLGRGAAQFGGELGAGEQGEVGQPEPDQEDDRAREGPVEPAVAAEHRGVEREAA